MKRLLTVVSLLPAWPALAQVQQAAPAPVELDRVQVVATRVPRDVRDVPASVDVVDLQSAPVDSPGTTLAERVRAVPGVFARDRHNQAQDEQLSIRGFGTRASFGIRGVRVLLDGVPATMPDGQGQVSHVPWPLAARIEVLRGPFSVLHGNAAGGVVQVWTVDGEAPASIGMAVDGGSDGARRVALDTRGARDAWQWSLGASHATTDGPRPHAQAERTLVHLKLARAIGDGSLRLVADAIDAPAQDPLGLDAAQWRADPHGVAPAAVAFDTRKTLAQRQLGLVWAQHADGSGWQAMAYAGRRSATQFLAIPPAAQRSPLSGGGVVDLRAPYAGVDLRWSGAGTLVGRPLELTAGASLDRLRQDRHGYENFVGDTLGVRGALRLDQDDRVDADDQFLQATWWPRTDLSLLAGVRHARLRFASSDHYVTARNPDDSGRVTHADTAPVAGIDWRASPRWTLYGAWGSGFETPTLNELAYRGDGGSGPNFALRPARTRSTELGTKFDDTGRLRATLAVFRAGTRDELTVATSSGGRTTYQNVGHARRRGAEASATWTPDPRWRVQLALSWLDARFGDAFLACTATPCARADTPVPAGRRLPGVPEGSAYLAVRHGGERGWHWQLDLRAQGAVPVNAFHGERAPGYGVLGLGAGYGFARGDGEGRVVLGIDNLAGRRYVGSVIVNEGNRRYYEPGDGRSVHLGVAWRWRP